MGKYAPMIEIRRALLATLALGVLMCGVYPLVVWGIARIAFPDKAGGSLVKMDGKVVGSSEIAQSSHGPKYFHPRPSAAGAGFDAASSGGSNLGPLSSRLHDLVKERVEAYRAENGLGPDELVPADAVTASGSGLDPHIGLRNAELQARRTAKARALGLDEVLRLIRENTEGPDLGFLGEPGVNVLKLNLALDAVRPGGIDGER